jgi:phage-related protein
MRKAEQENRIKPISWIGSSQEDLKEFPTEAQRTIGYALYVAQVGEKHPRAKPLKGLPGVLEIRTEYASNAYRAIYTAKIGDVIYVLHVFQKKSKRGIGTPIKEIDRIKRRLKIAQALARGG